MSEHLPPAMTPANCDLQGFHFMPLYVARLRDSGMAARVSGDEFRAAVLLWCAAWHQVPAASLPNDDFELSVLAGYGRVVKEWLKVREHALRKFVLCEDGRLYHPFLAEKANESWEAKLDQSWRTACGALKKRNQRDGTNIPALDFAAWRAAGCPTGEAFASAAGTVVPAEIAHVPGTEGVCPGDMGGKLPGHGVQETGRGREIKEKPSIQPTSVSVLPRDARGAHEGAAASASAGAGVPVREAPPAGGQDGFSAACAAAGVALSPKNRDAERVIYDGWVRDWPGFDLETDMLSPIREALLAKPGGSKSLSRFGTVVVNRRARMLAERDNAGKEAAGVAAARGHHDLEGPDAVKFRRAIGRALVESEVRAFFDPLAITVVEGVVLVTAPSASNARYMRDSYEPAMRAAAKEVTGSFDVRIITAGGVQC